MGSFKKKKNTHPKKKKPHKNRVEKRLHGGWGVVKKREIGKRVQKHLSYEMNKAEHLTSKPW